MWRRAVFVLTSGLAFAQTPQPFQSQSPASVTYGFKDGQQTVAITNVAYQVVEQRLLLRITTRTAQVLDEIGMEASTTVEAWPLGVDLKQKPLYAIKVPGVDCKIVEGMLLIILRGLEDTEWWSVYKLGTGQWLFDTHVPLLSFSIRRDIQTMRFVGFEVPADGEKDPRLKEPHTVGELTYASADRVLRQALITSDDPKQAQMLRSFADASRSVTLVDAPARALKLSISQNYPFTPATVSITVPIVSDDLDLAQAQAPAHLHIAAFKR